jgi:GTP-binding protein
MKEYEEDIRRRLNFMDFVPVIFTSAKTGYNVAKLLELTLQVYNERHVRVG